MGFSWQHLRGVVDWIIVDQNDSNDDLHIRAHQSQIHSTYVLIDSVQILDTMSKADGILYEKVAAYAAKVAEVEDKLKEAYTLFAIKMIEILSPK